VSTVIFATLAREISVNPMSKRQSFRAITLTDDSPGGDKLSGRNMELGIRFSAYLAWASEFDIDKKREHASKDFTKLTDQDIHNPCDWDMILRSLAPKFREECFSVPIIRC